MGLSGGQAHAGTLTAILSWGGGAGQQLTITGGPFATLATNNGVESLTFNTTALNAYLSTHGSGLTYQSGSGIADNEPSATTTAALVSNGTLVLRNPGATTMTVTAFMTDFTSPMPQTTLSSTGSGTFVGSATGDNSSFTSWYNSNNTAPTTSSGAGIVSAGPATTTVTTGGAGTNPTSTTPPGGSSNSALGFSATFSLTNQEVISLTRTGNVVATAYGGETIVLGSIVPEPASIVMMLTGMPVPLIVLGMLRRRKAKAGSKS